MKVLFLTPYPLHVSPSQRFRFEQYFKILSTNGIQWHVQSFLALRNWTIFYGSGKEIQKMLVLLTGFARRVLTLTKVAGYDFVFIHREVTPIGPPVFEWVIAKVFRKKIIYDFDDAIWSTDNVNEGKLEKLIRWRSKVGSICKWSYKVSCGNDYLCAFAQQYNSTVIYNPTTIDTSGLHTPQIYKSVKNKITIGWTGSHSTLKYLKPIEHVLAKLEQEYPQSEILIIANQKPDLQLKSLRFLPWQLVTEAEDLAKIDIGIMPLPDDEWTKGKCGFKALQYMAMEIPSVVSKVGVNDTIVDHGVNGFHATSSGEWLESLVLLINDKILRAKMGEAGRKKVIAQYSIASNTSTFLSLFL